MSEPEITITVAYDRDSREIVVGVDINGSPWFDGSGPTLESALLDALEATARYALRSVEEGTDHE